MNYGWDDLAKFIPKEATEAAEEVARAACETDSMKKLVDGHRILVNRYFTLAGRRARLKVELAFDEPKNPGVPDGEEEEGTSPA